MKTIVNKALRLMLVAVVGLSLLGCQKGYEMTLPLAVSRGEIKLTSATGKSYFMVYSTSDWEITYGNSAEWLRLSTTKGEGETQVNFEYDENNSVSRGVTLILTSGLHVCSLYIGQSGSSLEGTYTLGRTSYNFLAEPITLTLASETNLEDETISLGYVDLYYSQADNEDWISGIEIKPDGITFTLAENLSGVKRDAQVEITFPAAQWDSPVKTIFTIEQDSRNATMGDIVNSVVVDPNGINPVNIELGVNFAPEFYDYKVDFSVRDNDGNAVTWLRNTQLNSASTLFTAHARANRVADRTAILTFRLVNGEGTVLETKAVTLSQAKSDAEGEGGIESGSGEEPKDDEQDF